MTHKIISIACCTRLVALNYYEHIHSSYCKKKIINLNRSVCEHNNTFYNWNDPFNWFLLNEWKKQNGVRWWKHATPTAKWNPFDAPIIKISLRIYLNIGAGDGLLIVICPVGCGFSFSLKNIQSCFVRFCVGLSGWECVSGWSGRETGRQGKYIACVWVNHMWTISLVFFVRQRRSHGVYFVTIILMAEALA